MLSFRDYIEVCTYTEQKRTNTPIAAAGGGGEGGYHQGRGEPLTLNPKP